jgi:hypothetical protein
LGFSPFHARTVALVLNPITGYVSPHFHVVFDPTFATVNGQDGNQAPISLRQAKCGFTRHNFSRFAHTTRNEAPPEFIQPSMSAEGTIDSDPPTEMNKESTTPPRYWPIGNHDCSDSVRCRDSGKSFGYSDFRSAFREFDPGSSRTSGESDHRVFQC